MMIYTSAFYHDLDQTLEQAQTNKLNMLCEKVGLKEGMTFLDIGCGWGTLVRWAASKFGAKATGVTLSAEGAAWCRGRAEADGLSPKQCEILNCDYREIPAERKFDAISAVEMAEHVGIANFGLFLDNVRSMLADDGIFYMQVRLPPAFTPASRPRSRPGASSRAARCAGWQAGACMLHAPSRPRSWPGASSRAARAPDGRLIRCLIA